MSYNMYSSNAGVGNRGKQTKSHRSCLGVFANCLSSWRVFTGPSRPKRVKKTDIGLPKIPLADIQASMRQTLAVNRTGRPNLRDNHALAHHPSGQADEYYFVAVPAPWPQAHIRPRHRSPAPLRQRPLLFQRKPDPRQQRAFSFANEDFTATKLHGAHEQGEFVDVDLSDPYISNLHFSQATNRYNAWKAAFDNDFDEIEAGTHIPMAQPAKQHMATSDDSFNVAAGVRWSDTNSYHSSSDYEPSKRSSAVDSDNDSNRNIPMAQPSKQRMRLSVDSEDNIPVARPATRRMALFVPAIGGKDDVIEVPYPDRADSVASHQSYDVMGIRATGKEVHTDMYMGRREALAHTIALLEGPDQRESMAAELCFASTSSGPSSPLQAATPELTYTNTIDASGSDSDNQPQQPPTPQPMDTSILSSIRTSYPGSSALDNTTTDTTTDIDCAVYFHRPNHPAIARFMHLWEDPSRLGPPVDHSLFADFDYSIEAEHGERLPMSDSVRDEFVRHNRRGSEGSEKTAEVFAEFYALRTGEGFVEGRCDTF